MVNNYILICQNKIIDIFYNSKYPIFAPTNLTGFPITCLTFDDIKLNNKIPEIGDIINENYSLIKNEPEIKLNLNIELPILEEENENFNNLNYDV